MDKGLEEYDLGMSLDGILWNGRTERRKGLLASSRRGEYSVMSYHRLLLRVTQYGDFINLKKAESCDYSMFLFCLR